MNGTIISDSGPCRVSVGGLNAVIDGTEWSAEVLITESSHELVVTCVDNVGSLTRKTINLVPYRGTIDTLKLENANAGEMAILRKLYNEAIDMRFNDCPMGEALQQVSIILGVQFLGIDMLPKNEMISGSYNRGSQVIESVSRRINRHRFLVRADGVYVVKSNEFLPKQVVMK